MQLGLFRVAAAKRTDARADSSRLRSARSEGAKAWNKKSRALPALVMEEVARKENLEEAFWNVAKNKGAPGPDGENIEEVGKCLPQVIARLSEALLEGTYQPGEIRRVWIPKPGGRRGLGIPNVIDRIVQQATLQVMQPHYEPDFDESSHGFRPGRSCHTAIAEAKGYLEEGYGWCVDIDLERFFDTVNHQRLLATLERKIADRRIVNLIGMMLTARIVMPDGLVETNEEGTPQGGPLSPLLSNIVLDELDKKLRERGLRFVRYCDDCNIFVKSEAAGQRVLQSTTRFIEGRLRLKVNQAKSAVSHPHERHFLGFSLEEDLERGEVLIRLSDKSKEKMAAKIIELTPRNWGRSTDECIATLNTYIRGWCEYFKLCSEAEDYYARRFDAHIRRRLRALHLKQWRRKRTIVKRLIQLGARPKTAWRSIYEGHRSLWKLSHIPVVDRALSNARFALRGLLSISERLKAARPIPSAQMQLAFV